MLHDNVLKRKLADGQMTHGLWVTLEAPTISEIGVELGVDWICVDAEHGHLDLKEVVEHLRVTNHTQTTSLVRITEIQQGLIKRVLDIGAAGIFVPQVKSAEEVALAVKYAKYPPWGVRGVGGERSTAWTGRLKETTHRANDETMVIPLIETVEAADVIEEILDVRGIDAIFFGPADFSASAGHLGEWEGPGIAERILEIKDLAIARGLPVGLMTTGIDDARMRQEQGFRMIGVASDTGLLMRGASQALKALRD